MDVISHQGLPGQSESPIIPIPPPDREPFVPHFISPTINCDIPSPMCIYVSSRLGVILYSLYCTANSLNHIELSIHRPEDTLQ